MPITRRSLIQTSLSLATLSALGANAASTEPGNLIRKTIPSTGETIPAVGIGTNRYGVGEDESARAPLRATLKTFYELGGTVIDTAPGYRTSEVVLGDLTQELGIADKLFMATKVDREGKQAGIERMHESLKTASTAQGGFNAGS